MLLVLALFVPALIIGILTALAVRRWPQLDPASARPAHEVATAAERARREHSRAARVLRSRADPAAITGLALTIALLVVLVGGVVVGWLAYAVRANHTLIHIDRSIAPWGYDHTTDLTRHVLNAVTWLGSTGGVITMIAAALIVELRRRPTVSLPGFLLAVLIGQAILSNGVKNVVANVRPTINPIARSLGHAFPSGHTVGAAACFAAAALVLGRGRSRNTQAILAGAAVAVAVAVAASRVLLGVHWLSDVLGGLALGWAWFMLCAMAFGGRLLRLGAPLEAAERAIDLADPQQPPNTPLNESSARRPPARRT